MENNEKKMNFSEALNMIKDSYKMQNEYHQKEISSLQHQLNKKNIIINQMKRKLNLLTEENNKNKEKILSLLKEIEELKKNNNNNNIIKNKPLLYEKPKILHGNKSCINLHNININSPFKLIDINLSKNKKSKYNLEPLKTFNYQKILEKIDSKVNHNGLNVVKRNLNTVYDNNLDDFDFLQICKDKMTQKDYNYIIENLNYMNSYLISRSECYNKISSIVKKNNPSFLKNFEDFFSSL